jgi:FtsZ-binding cell division protein ZapB
VVRKAATITEKQEDEIALLTNKVAHLKISNNELTREVTQLSSTVDYLEQDIIEKDDELEEAQEHLSNALSAQIDSCYKAEQYKMLAQSFKLWWNSCQKKLENDNSNLPNDPIVAIADRLSHDCADPGTSIACLCQGILTDENLIPHTIPRIAS